MTNLPEKKPDAVQELEVRHPWVKPAVECLALKDALSCSTLNLNDSCTGS